MHEAGYVLSGRKMEQPKPAGESSLPAPAQTIEISALKIQVQTSTGQMDQARNELRAVEERRDAERIELKAADRKLMEAHSKLENFRRRVAELVGQVLAQTAEDEDLRHRAQDLENRLVEQSRQLNESEIEIEHLRGEIDVVRKAEADLRIAMIEIDGRAHTATKNFKAEKEKLQAALDRANGERMRLAYDLANMKRQTDPSPAAAKSLMLERLH